ncbi:MAG: bifunctional precorrin-2 dehydrogenase/sirohydrochlorin ferrochelatase, partial [Chloroflexaceae bacterium]|nr:bifunctional precorrin-2 dehydrogenase/sirohydrochlorin ferrochelatase [Chloroflexaceae bacterium]
AESGRAFFETYPIVLSQLQGAVVIVVGGGQVAERKVRGLLAVGAAVRLISPSITPRLQLWADEQRINWEARAYQPGDLNGNGVSRPMLVFAATNQRETNAQVAREAASLHLLCNVVDQPEEGQFHLPAIYRDTDLVITVSTGGSSPTRARQVRDRIAALLQDEADSA